MCVYACITMCNVCTWCFYRGVVGIIKGCLLVAMATTQVIHIHVGWDQPTITASTSDLLLLAMTGDPPPATNLGSIPKKQTTSTKPQWSSSRP